MPHLHRPTPSLPPPLNCARSIGPSTATRDRPDWREPPTAQPNGHTANGRKTPIQLQAHGHHGCVKRKDGEGNGKPRATGKECPLASALRESKPALYDELVWVDEDVYGL